MKFFKLLGAFVAAVIVMAVLGSISASQFVLAALVDIGAQIAPGQWLLQTLKDLLGFAPTYALIVSVAFAIAFLVTWALLRFTPLNKSPLWYALAGAVAIGVTLVLMREVFFGLALVAGARSVAGIAMQVIAGAIAGWVFAKLRAQRWTELESDS